MSICHTYVSCDVNPREEKERKTERRETHAVGPTCSIVACPMSCLTRSICQVLIEPVFPSCICLFGVPNTNAQVEKDEQLRFALLIEAFCDADSSGVALVTDLIVFFNTLLSSAFEFEERVHLRSEMISAGILDAIDRIRDYYGLSKVYIFICKLSNSAYCCVLGDLV